jgi:hypothetical protein
MKNQGQWNESKFKFGTNGNYYVIPSRSKDYLNAYIVSGFLCDFYNTEFVSLIKDKTVLELGSGNCPIYPLIAMHANQYTTLDWPNSQHSTDYIDITHDLNTDILLDKFYDVIVAFDVMEHIYNVDTFLNTISKNLSKDGLTVISIPFLYWIHEDPHDYNRFTKFYLKRKLSEFGFVQVEINVYGGVINLFLDIIVKNLPTKLKLLIIQLIKITTRVDKVKSFRKELFPLYYIVKAKKLI